MEMRDHLPLELKRVFFSLGHVFKLRVDVNCKNYIMPCFFRDE
jgi:hypothetical protein